MFCRYCGKKKRLNDYRCGCRATQIISKTDRYCETCGEIIPARSFKVKNSNGTFGFSHTKLCEHCPPKEQCNLSGWANSLCRFYPERIITLKECDCDEKKLNHHPDYNKPFEIMKICRFCHKAEHKNMRHRRNTPPVPASQWR